MTRHVRALILAATVAIVATLGLATPAQAAHDGDCGSGEVCLYWSYSFSAGLADFGGDIANYTNYRFFHCSYSCHLNDNAASVRNRARFASASLHVDSWFRGGGVIVNNGQQMDGWQLGDYVNEFSSHIWI
jgi:hypothetical protein